MKTDDWTDLEQVAVPERAVGHGYAPAEVETLIAQGRWAPVLEASGATLVCCLTVDARIVLVETDQPVVALDRAAPGSHGYVIDARQGPGSVELASLRIIVEAGTVRIQARDPSTSTPDVAALLAKWPVEPWLSELVTQLAALGPLQKVAAIAALARYWRPARDPAALARFVAAGGPWQSARAWFASLDPARRDGVYRLGILEAAALQDRLEPLVELVAARDEGARPAVSAWLHRREDLACIHALGHRLNEPSDAWNQLGVALAALDEAALDWASIFVDAGVSRDERLWAVTRADPLAWWGKVGA